MVGDVKSGMMMEMMIKVMMTTMIPNLTQMLTKEERDDGHDEE